MGQNSNSLGDERTSVEVEGLHGSAHLQATDVLHSKIFTDQQIRTKIYFNYRVNSIHFMTQTNAMLRILIL